MEKIDVKKSKMPKEMSQDLLKKMLGNILKAVGIMSYFLILNLAYSSMKLERLTGDIEVFAGVFLVAGIVLLDIAYKKDNGSTAITGIECLVLSIHSLLIMHVITLFKYDFRYYLLTSAYIFSIYYVLKDIVIYTKGRRDYLKSLSDIADIVKKEEPAKKEATKKYEEEVKEDDIKETVKKERKTKTKKVQETKNDKNKTKKKKTEKGETAKKETKVSKTKSKTTKKEEEKAPEKKKRGRPKKEEVVKND